MWVLAGRFSQTTVLPTVGQVLDVLAHPLREPPNLDAKSMLHNAGISVLRVVVGFCLAALTGVPLGILVGVSVLARRMASPLLEVLRPICPIAWIPLAIIVFGLVLVL